MQCQVSMMKLHSPHQAARPGSGASLHTTAPAHKALARTGLPTQPKTTAQLFMLAATTRTGNTVLGLFHLSVSLQVPSALLTPLPSCSGKFYTHTLAPLCSVCSQRFRTTVKRLWGSSDLNSDPCLFWSWEVWGSLLCKYRWEWSLTQITAVCT